MSVTYKQASQKNINKAIAKAKDLKPRVKINGFNDFTVTGSKGDAYSVKFSGKGQDFTAHCTCKGSERELVCYHAAAVAPIFKAQIKERAAMPVCEVEDCGQEVAAKGLCQEHLNDFELLRAETVHPFQDLLDGAGIPCSKCQKPAAKLVNGLCVVCEAEACLY